MAEGIGPGAQQGIIVPSAIQNNTCSTGSGLSMQPRKRDQLDQEHGEGNRKREDRWKCNIAPSGITRYSSVIGAGNIRE